MKKAPDTYIIIFFVVLFAGLLTHLVPVGKFQTQEVTYTENEVSKTHEVLIPESFEVITDEHGSPVRDGIGLFDADDNRGILNYLFEGLVSGSKWGTAVGVVAFILIIGGSFGIILHTGSVEAMIHAIIGRYKNSGIILIPALFILFSAGGAIFGMGESAIAFAMVIVPLMVSLGYDSITAVMVTYMATQIGFATSWMNPFSVAIAQGIAGIPVMSGSGFRIIMWIGFTVLGAFYALRYGQKIRRNPQKSSVYESDNFFRDQVRSDSPTEYRFTLGHKLVIAVIVIGMAWVIIGVSRYGYYIPEIATQFFIMGLVSGVIGVLFKLNAMGINDIAASFRTGAKEILGAALVVGMAKGIIVVLGGDQPDQANVLNTILYHTGNMLQGVPNVISAWCMYLFQSIFNFFVVSGSGQAALTMPIMAPLADIVGVTRQVAVLAYQLGDGFTNLIVPTSGALIGTLAVARIDWLVWAKFQVRLQLILVSLGSALVIIAFLMGFS